MADVDELATAFHRRAEAKGNRSSWVNDRSLVLAAHRVLFHLGVLDTPPEDPRRRPGLAGHYSGVGDEPLRTLFLDYCEQAAATGIGQRQGDRQPPRRIRPLPGPPPPAP